MALQEERLLDISQFPEVMANPDHFPANLFEFPRMVREASGMSATDIYGWPTFKVMTSLFYDKNKFTANGLEPPTTYDEFWELLDQIKASGKYRNAVARGNHRWVVFNNFWQVATALIWPDVSDRLISGDLHFDDPEVIQVWEFYDRLADGGYVDTDYNRGNGAGWRRTSPT